MRGRRERIALDRRLEAATRRDGGTRERSGQIVRRLGESSGEVHGIDKLRAYWGSGLESESDLHFTVEDVRYSVDTIVINYRNQHGHAVAEVLRFRDGLVCWGCGAYAPS